MGVGWWWKFPWKVYKLVIETLKYKSILESLITKCQIEKKEKWLGKGRCLCIVYEFLIGSGLRKMFLIIHSSNSLQLIHTISYGPYDMNNDMGHMCWRWIIMKNTFLSPDPIRNSYTMQRHLPFPSHFSFFSIWHFVIKLSRIDLYFNVSITNLYTFHGNRTTSTQKSIPWEFQGRATLARAPVCGWKILLLR